MKFYGPKLWSMTKYKKTLAYLVVILGLVLLANAANADAASKGVTSFKVGSERVDRTTTLSNDGDEYVRVHVFIGGRETDLIETRHDACLAYFYGSGVSVRLNSCKAGERATIRAVNASDTIRRVTVKWAIVQPEAKRRG